jgi:hypothetical protein
MAAPKFRDFLPPLPQSPTSSVLRTRPQPLQADTLRSQILLAGSPPKIRIEFETHAGTDFSEGQQFSEFPALV